MITLFSAQAEDGNSTAVDVTAGQGMLVAWGTFGSGTIKLQITPNGGTTWLDVPGISLTAAGVKPFALDFYAAPSNVQMRAALSGATTPSLSAGIL